MSDQYLSLILERINSETNDHIRGSIEQARSEDEAMQIAMAILVTAASYMPNVQFAIQVLNDVDGWRK